MYFFLAKKKMSKFNVYYEFFKDCDENHSSTWCISNDKYSISYYYNDDNVNFKEKLNHLNIITNKSELSKKSWRLPFSMKKSFVEQYIYDYKK